MERKKPEINLPNNHNKVFNLDSYYSITATDGNYSPYTNHLLNLYKNIIKHPKEGIKITLGICKEIFINELDIDYESVSFLMKYALSECFCFYLQVWKGWEEPQKPFEELKEYLKLKIQFIVEHQNRFCEPAKNADDLKHLNEDGNVPMYSLIVDRRTIKEEKIKWLPLSVQEFINYPTVMVKVNLPYLNISRRMVLGYQQYPKDFSYEDMYVNAEMFVQKKESAIQWTHSKKEILEFIGKILEITKSFGDKINVAEELTVILEEFAMDLKEFSEDSTIDVPSTSGYQIGKSFFCRNQNEKSFQVDSDDSQMAIIPHVVFSILNCKPESNLVTTTKQKKRFVDQINDSITYMCTACSLKFGKKEGFLKMIEHYLRNHQPEPSITCLKCLKNIKVFDILGNRWQHDC